MRLEHDFLLLGKLGLAAYAGIVPIIGRLVDRDDHVGPRIGILTFSDAGRVVHICQG